MADPFETAMAVRRATAADRDFVCRLGSEAFRRFGDYETLLPQWLAHPDVETFVASIFGRDAGLAMLGFRTARDGTWVGDLLAIAVDRNWMGRGIGGALLSRVEAVVQAATIVSTPVAIRLDVAEANAPARRLFERHGFRVARVQENFYREGQRALEMVKSVGTVA